MENDFRLELSSTCSLQPAACRLEVLHSISELSSLPGPLILVGGTFDGLHLGHQALIRRAQEEAQQCGGEVVVMTFDQHPAALLRPDKAPRLITTISQKKQLLEKLGVKWLLLLPFDEALAATPAEQFINELVSVSKNLKAICVGASWSFGQGGKGNLALLRQLGEHLHFSVITIEPIQVTASIVSSTRIRQAVALGNLDEVAACLGRRYALSGLVVRGEGRGKTLGFPTANLDVENQQLPPNGVYAIQAQVRGFSYQGVANIGVRPTVEVENAPRTIEVHLLDFQGDLYGEEIALELVIYLREEKKFPSLEALRTQIQLDVEKARGRVKSEE